MATDKENEVGDAQRLSMKFAESRILNDAFPRLVYKPSSTGTVDEVVTKGLHFGQRKLLLSEIEFLTECFASVKGCGAASAATVEHSKPFLVVYAGAANGSHLPYLFRMFPSVKFVLIDPAPFCAAVREIARQPGGPVLELVEDFCSDELCLRLARAHHARYAVLLISDVRSGAPTRNTNRENTRMIMRDNEQQRGWCASLRAAAALLKFRPPYPPSAHAKTNKNESENKNEKKSENKNKKKNENKDDDDDDDTPGRVVYMDGARLFGVWAPKSSSEVRLCAAGPFARGLSRGPTRPYDCTVHEEQCYFYNTDKRYARDCEAERCILARYKEVFPGFCPGGVVELSNSISEFLRFPLFQPLEESFTERDARWVTLLYSTRDPDALKLFEPLRELITLDAIRLLIKKWGDAEDIPSCGEIGQVTLSKEFWKVMCVGNLSEAYNLPRIRWRFASKFFSRKTVRATE